MISVRRHLRISMGLYLWVASLAGCTASLSSGKNASSGGPLEIGLQVLGDPPPAAPRAIRVSFKNTSSAPVSFEEPRPRCAESELEGLTLLGLSLTDSTGRESPWGTIYTEHFQANVPDPQSRTLAPGESWSMDVDLDQMYFWGSCGPASPISAMLQPEPAGIELRALVVVNGATPLRSPPISIQFTIPSTLFDEPGSTRTEVGRQETQEERAQSNAASRLEERRRTASAIRALRNGFSRIGKEPEAQGKALSSWVEEYSDPSLQFADEGSPEEARQLKARDAVLEIGPAAAPFLVQALEIGYDISERAAELLHDLFEAGQVDDRILLGVLRSESEQGHRGVLKALDPGESLLPGRKKPVPLSPQLISALGEVLDANKPILFLNRNRIPKALGRPGLKAAVPVLMRALNVREDSVRSAAARALSVIGPEAKESIPALKALEQKITENREKRVARSALMALGERLPDPFDFLERMEQYFHDRAARAPIEETTEASLGTWPTGVDAVFFVVDRSGTSMEGFRFSKRYIPRVLTSLGEGREYGIIFVDRQARSYPDGGKPAKWSQEGLAAALGFVQNAERGVGSCPAEGFNAALELAAASSARRKAIVYIGDGGGTCGGLDEADYLERMGDEITRKNGESVEIHAIGVRASLFCEAVLLNLTERNGGTYRRLLTAR